MLYPYIEPLGAKKILLLFVLFIFNGNVLPFRVLCRASGSKEDSSSFFSFFSFFNGNVFFYVAQPRQQNSRLLLTLDDAVFLLSFVPPFFFVFRGNVPVVGGIIEMDAILPGEHDIGGLWPAFWLLGNLGRATYEASTNLV